MIFDVIMLFIWTTYNDGGGGGGKKTRFGVYDGS